ncbi:hypothetical protein AXG93_3349s1020 [Marchantia polymorpha subsp. ruderalis]|uniref:Uncharacterized protein n=1 Tax=Marchantia polymorpha subsp. ruderalis TaxID=1480154 RepID=A0A176WEW5_MARPO|nr:hypothetical protein AXG93_3349s1020 [Marchantia polymorpha subsp. ruderalis]
MQWSSLEHWNIFAEAQTGRKYWICVDRSEKGLQAEYKGADVGGPLQLLTVLQSTASSRALSLLQQGLWNILSIPTMSAKFQPLCLSSVSATKNIYRDQKSGILIRSFQMSYKQDYRAVFTYFID